MKKQGKTDWDRVKAEATANAPIAHDPTTDPYDPNDEAAVNAFFDKTAPMRRRGPQKAPTKRVVTMRLSPDVVDTFRATGDGWQTRIDNALKDWLKTHTPA
jgi:uncharacterized protein (DUF4415 family)